MDPYRSLLVLMDCNVFLWVLIGPYVTLCVFLLPYKSLCILKKSNVSFWVLIVLDAYLYVLYASIKTHKDALGSIKTLKDSLESIITKRNYKDPLRPIRKQKNA